MKPISKISAAMITASFLAVQFVFPVQAAPDLTAKAGLTASAKGNVERAAWDKSTLSFVGQSVVPGGVAATITNGGSSMQDGVVYAVYRSEQGNPKNGEVVATGVINPLGSDESTVLTYTPEQLLPGIYMFKAYQRPGHPGTGELWSGSIEVKETDAASQQLEPVRPYDQFFNSSVEDGKATFTVPEGIGKVQISFTSYVYPEGVVPQELSNPYTSQSVYDNVTKVYGPGTYTVDVALPESGYWQTDLYLGPVMQKLTEIGHPWEKIIDADTGLAN